VLDVARSDDEEMLAEFQRTDPGQPSRSSPRTGASLVRIMNSKFVANSCNAIPKSSYPQQVYGTNYDALQIYMYTKSCLVSTAHGVSKHHQALSKCAVLPNVRSSNSKPDVSGTSEQMAGLAA